LGITTLPRKTQWKERDGTLTKGRVVREVSVRESFPWGDYYKVVQLMELHMVGGKALRRPDQVVRFGYYVKDHGAPKKKYGWGSQTTLIVSKANFRKLIQRVRNTSFV
jgi:hypothetical protein